MILIDNDFLTYNNNQFMTIIISNNIINIIVNFYEL